MTERRTHNANLHDVNHRFAEEIWQLTPHDINRFNTIVYWVFGSIASPDQQYYFIKNWLFSSNYREKINGKLNYGGQYQYIEEVDTGIPIVHEEDGSLTSESWHKIFEFKKQLNSIYTKEFI